ncbi:MAG: MlaD family protein [Acidimicrobiales bacterium]
MAARRRRKGFPSFLDLNLVAVGFVCLVALGAVVAGAFAVGALQLFTPRYELSAVFDNTGGMKPGAEVRLAGVRVGQVTGLHPDFERGQVVLTFNVNRRIDLGPETRAEIAINTLLGGFFLRLDGPVTEPYLESLDHDDPRRRIPLERTQGSFSFITALSEFSELADDIDTERLNAVVEDIAGSMTRNRDVIPRVIDNVNAIGEAVLGREQQIRDLVAEAQQVGATLAARDQQIVAVMDAASVLLDTLATRRDDITTTLGSGSQIAQVLAETIESHRVQLDTIFSSTGVLFDRIDNNLPAINEGLARAGPLFVLIAAAALGNAELEPGTTGFQVDFEGGGIQADHGRYLGCLLRSVIEPDSCIIQGATE